MTEETLFQEALACPPEERDAFLDAACAGDPALREAIAALLDAHERPGHPLDRPLETDTVQPVSSGVPSAQADATLDEPARSGPSGGATRTADHIPRSPASDLIAGRYTLGERLGEGGMGEVWVAQQSEPVKRKVALKLIKRGMDSRAVLQRFEQERQALALMDHPHIAKVLDAGATAHGQPFFVMELVQGLPLNKYCDQERLTPRERLELFVPICQAVQHAHQKGIVHRDLKPANILVATVDGKAVPKVIDFGVAKAMSGKLTDISLSTQFGAVVGTLEYMSPEQAGYSGEDIDTRADIYSLGVVLYELLTGLRPIDSKRLKRAALSEMVRIIREEEPSKPSTRLSTEESLPSVAALRQTDPRRLMTMLRGELDWVVMKCLEKRRDLRYETANGLARDIQRYLANEPVEARPPSATYRLRKFVRRHRGQVVAAGLVLAAMLAGTVGTTLGLIEANRQADRARAEAREKEDARREEAQQRALAERANQQAYESLRSFTDELMEKVLGGRSQLTDNEKAILKRAEKQWEVFAQSEGTSPRARTIRADGAENLALVRAKLGLRQEALENHRLAMETRAQLADEFPDEPKYRAAQARAHQNIGSVLRALGKQPEGEEQFRLAGALFRHLVDGHPDVPDYRWRLAESAISLGNALRDRGDLAGAEALYRGALKEQEGLAAAHPDKDDYVWSVARSHWGLAFTMKRLERFAEAEGHYRMAIATMEQLAARAPANNEYPQDTAALRRELGVMLYDSGEPAKGVVEFPPAIAIQAKLVAQFPAMPSYASDLGRTERDYARAYLLLDQPGDGLEHVHAAEALFEKLVAASPNVLPFQADLGLTYRFHGDLETRAGGPAAALDWYDKALRVLGAARVQGPNDVLIRRSLASTHAGRAAALDELARHAEALRDCDQAIALSDGDRRPQYRGQRAGSLVQLDRVPEAVAELGSLFAETSSDPKRDYEMARAFALASTRDEAQRRERADRAVELFRRAVSSGFKDGPRARRDKALGPLRARDDFQRLLDDLERPAAARP